MLVFYLTGLNVFGMASVFILSSTPYNFTARTFIAELLIVDKFSVFIDTFDSTGGDILEEVFGGIAFLSFPQQSISIYLIFVLAIILIVF
jgi:hypothetical protein